MKPKCTLSITFAALFFAAPLLQAAGKGGIDAQLKEIEARWAKAFQTHDVSVLEDILAEDFVVTDEKGKLFDRSGAIKDFKQQTDTIEKTSNANVAVHSINSDAAVVTGTTHEVGKHQNGEKFDRVYRWTDTFINRNGKWQCVASQLMVTQSK